MDKKKLNEIQVEDVMNKKWIPYVIFFLCTAFLHVFGYNFYGDDWGVYKNLQETPWDELKSLSYIIHGWSSRFLINPIIHFVMHFDYRIWMVIDIALFMAIFHLIRIKYVKSDRIPHLYVLMSLMNIVSYLDFHELGWVVTTITYIWVATAALIACASIENIFADINTKWYMVIVYLLLTVFATNKEEVAVMLFIIFAVATVTAILCKKKWIVLFVQLGISTFSLFYHMLSPNNISRYERKFATHAIYNTFTEKMIIGISTTIRRIFFQRSFVFLAFVIVLILITWFTCKKLIPRIASIVPLVLWFMTWVPGEIDYMFGTNTYSGVRVWATIVLGVIGVLAIFICIYYIYGFNYKLLKMVTILTAGFAGRCVVGFANSGWQAYERTYTFLYLAFVIVGTMMVCDSWEKLSKRKKQILFGVIIVIGQLGFAKNILDIGIL